MLKFREMICPVFSSSELPDFVRKTDFDDVFLKYLIEVGDLHAMSCQSRLDPVFRILAVTQIKSFAFSNPSMYRAKRYFDKAG